MVKLSYRHIRSFFLLTTFGVAVFYAGFSTAKYAEGEGAAPIVRSFLNDPSVDQAEGADFSRFWDVWRRLEKSYVDPDKLDYSKMTFGSMQGLAQSLGDPYTQYLPPVENKQANEDLNGSFGGVGIELGYKETTLAVMAPLKGTPAERAGVQAGDLILNIKDDKKNVDVDTHNMTLADAVRNIRGEKGTQVILTLYRDGSAEPFDITLTREEIVVPSVELTFVEHDGKQYAHLQLHRFGGRTDKEWLTKVSEIVAKKPAGVVLDLRNNPGGYLDGAVFVSGEFLADGVVVEQRGRLESETYRVDRKGRLTTVPLVILVNKGSASASEITAGAIQDHKRAKIVGETTFGKGTVQEVQELSDGSSLHVTIAKWILPSGRWLDKDGIRPEVEALDNIETKDVDEALDKALEQF